MDVIQAKEKIAASGFYKEPVMLGAGAYGEVILYEYTGPDESIKALCNQGKIAIKFSNTLDEKEAATGEYLANQNFTVPSRVNPSKILKDGDGNPLGIMTKYQFYSPGKTYKHADLASAIYNAALPPNPITKKNGPAAFKQGMDKDPGVFMAQIIASMQQAQHELNRRGVIHGDIAGRNFMTNARYDNQGRLMEVSSVLIDFGMSELLDRADSDHICHVQSKTGPIRWMDMRRLQSGSMYDDQQLSVLSDLYSNRAAMIGLIGSLGFGNHDCDNLYIDLITETLTEVALAKSRFLEGDNYVKADEKCLEKILDNLDRNLLIRNMDSNKRIELLDLLKCYKPYITQLPQSTDPKIALAEDQKLMDNAHNAYVKMQLDKISNRLDNGEVDLESTLARLKIIPCTDPKLLERLNDLGQQAVHEEIHATRIETQPAPADLTGQSASQSHYAALNAMDSSVPEKQAANYAPLTPPESHKHNYAPLTPPESHKHNYAPLTPLESQKHNYAPLGDLSSNSDDNTKTPPAIQSEYGTLDSLNAPKESNQDPTPAITQKNEKPSSNKDPSVFFKNRLADLKKAKDVVVDAVHTIRNKLDL